MPGNGDGLQADTLDTVEMRNELGVRVSAGEEPGIRIVERGEVLRIFVGRDAPISGDQDPWNADTVDGRWRSQSAWNQEVVPDIAQRRSF